jgi:hypothetical protein
MKQMYNNYKNAKKFYEGEIQQAEIKKNTSRIQGSYIR